VAATLTLGRQQLIPEMYRQIRDYMPISADQAPTFHRYLEHHIERDGDHYDSLAMRLLEVLCEDDRDKILETETAAEEAICARIRFWDGILEASTAGRND